MLASLTLGAVLPETPPEVTAVLPVPEVNADLLLEVTAVLLPEVTAVLSVPEVTADLPPEVKAALPLPVVAVSEREAVAVLPVERMLLLPAAEEAELLRDSIALLRDSIALLRDLSAAGRDMVPATPDAILVDGVLSVVTPWLRYGRG